MTYNMDQTGYVFKILSAIPSTHLVHKNEINIDGLDQDTLEKYLDDLHKTNFISANHVGSANSYRLTAYGVNWLLEYQRHHQLMCLNVRLDKMTSEIRYLTWAVLIVGLLSVLIALNVLPGCSTHYSKSCSQSCTRL